MTEDGIEIFSSEKQLSNAFGPIFVTEEGISIEIKDEHQSNVFDSICFKDEHISIFFLKRSETSESKESI